MLTGAGDGMVHGTRSMNSFLYQFAFFSPPVLRHVSEGGVDKCRGGGGRSGGERSLFPTTITGRSTTGYDFEIFCVVPYYSTSTTTTAGFYLLYYTRGSSIIYGTSNKRALPQQPQPPPKSP